MVRTITVRELVEETTALLDAVEAGETFIVARDGRPVAQLVPIGHGRRRGATTDGIRSRFKGLGRIDDAEMRREIEDFFGDDDRIREEDYE